MQKQLRFSYLIIIFMLGLLITEGPAFSQTPPPEHQEEHDTKDLEELLKRYNTDAEKVIEDTSKLHNIQNTEAASEVGEGEIEPVAPIKISVLKDKDKKKDRPAVVSSLSESVALALSPIQELSEAQLLRRLEENLAGSALKPYADEFPNVVLFAVKLIKDKKSIPSLVKILENKDRLIEFGSVMLFTIIFGFILKRVMHREGRTFLRAATYYLFRFFFMFFLRISIIWYYFNVEMKPAVMIFKKTFF